MSTTDTQHAAGQECLRVDGFIRQYGPDVQIGPISFTVGEGEFFSLLGPSGCGKSTMLRAIAGFESVDQGSIRLRGEPIQDKPANRRGVGLVFQRHALFPHLTVEGNVGFGLRLRRHSRRAIRERVASALELVGLEGMGARFPSQLSGGQQQRVALARSLVLEPPLLLLDEPLSSLDLKLRIQMRTEIRRLQTSLNKATIFVTHDQNEALSMSDRIAVLSDGRIEQIGTPREIYNQPRTPFVANFIGASNRFHVRDLSRESERVLVQTEEGPALVLPADSPVQVGSILLVRPERIRPAREVGDAVNCFTGTLLSEQYLGEDIQLRLEIEHGVELALVYKSPGDDQAAAEGAGYDIAIAPEDIYVIPES